MKEMTIGEMISRLLNEDDELLTELALDIERAYEDIKKDTEKGGN